MKANKIISTVTLAAAIGAFGFANTSLAAEKTDIKWLPVSQVATQIESAGFTNIHEIERSRMGYKVEAVNADGKMAKILVNGETGEIIKQFELTKDGKMRQGDRQEYKNMRKMHQHQNCDTKKGTE